MPTTLAVESPRTGRTDDLATTMEGRLLRSLAQRIGEETCTRYFDRHAVVSVRDGGVRVGVRSGFVADLMTRRFAGPLREAAAEALGDDAQAEGIRLSIEVDAPQVGAGREGIEDVGVVSVAEAPVRRPRQGVVTRHRLEDFVVGKPNELAHSAALRLTADDCQGNFSRLVVHGSCGLGKTHLLQGIARRHEERFPGSTVRYVTSEKFTNEFITALRGDRLDSFRRSYRGVDLLCVDDVHFLSSKQATQEELLHTFDALDLAGARVAMASDEHPKLIRRLNRALVSRCLSGMIVKLDAPDRDLTARIAIENARKRGLQLHEDAASLVAETLCRPTRKRPASVREIEGLVTRIEAVARLLANEGSDMIGVAMVRRALGMDADAITSARRRSVSVQLIASEVCAELGVEEGELQGSGRHRRVVLARSLTAYLCRRLTNKSFPEIARAMGRPSHSTIVTACKRIEGQIGSMERVRVHDDSPAETTLQDLTDKLTHAIAQAAVQI